jgi:drug/metabolite transporter (DMT)-like permease
MVVIFGRMVVASAAFACFIPRMGLAQVRRADVKWMVLMTVCEPGLYFLCEARALELTTSGQAGMVLALLPACVGVAAALLLRERLTPAFVAGCVVALAGIALLSAGAVATEAAPNPWLGNLYEFLAMLCAVAYTLGAKVLVARYRTLLVASLQAFGGVVFFLPFLFLPGTALPTELHLNGVLAILFLGLCVTLAAYLLYVFGIRSIPAGKASMTTNLIPVFAVGMGWLLLGETLTWAQVAAVPLVLAGVLFSQTGGRAPAV